MGFGEGDLLFDSPTGAYYAGQHVNGRLVFELNTVKKIRGIYLRVNGYCNVHWTTSHTRRVNDRTEHYTVSHDSNEEYIDLKMYLIGSKNSELNLNPGKYEYPFEFQLPGNAPSSFEGSKGHVRYEVKAVVDRPFAIDDEKVRQLRVYAPLDLNRANCSEPVHMEFDQTFCCWCMSAGSSATLVKLPVRGYCPGQVIPVELSCHNRSNVEINTIKFAIKKEVKYYAQVQPATEEEKSVVLELKKGPIAGHTDRNFSLEMKVPDLDVYNMQDCSFIDIRYLFKVTVETDGCHTDEDDTVELVFGTIPLVGFQDDVPNPLQSQMPQSNFIPQTIMPQNYPSVNAPYPTPIINQPVGNQPYQGYPDQTSPYPNPSYPGQNVPEPNVPLMAPYPNQNQSPYPNPPFPQNNSPYPNANPPQGSPYLNRPFPNGQPLPFPSPNPPYLGSSPANPPYPDNSSANPPYPGSSPANPPYPVTPTADPPYQGNSPANPPYPVTSTANLPYPGNSPANPPYPVTSTANLPYPGNSPANPPYPVTSTTNPPYPADSSSNSPYSSRAATSPYPGAPKSPYNNRNPALGMGGSLGTGRSLRTGNLGFIGTPDPAKVPLLPEGAVPFPIASSPANPYATASAPAPATPDNENEKPLAAADNNSPYNPEFIEEKKKEEEKDGNK